MSAVAAGELALLLAAAVLEELIFRAGLQESLLRQIQRPALAWRIAGASAPNVITALAFSLAHGFSRAWLLALAVFPAALLLGGLYERRRRVGPCIALHAAMNGLWFLVASLYPRGIAPLL